MKLYELEVGQKFEFIERNRNIQFEVTDRMPNKIVYKDVATGQERTTTSNRKTFREDVFPVVEDKVVVLKQDEKIILIDVLETAHKDAKTEEMRSIINKIYLKVK